MKHMTLFNVAPSMPEAIGFLEQLAGNYWWVWNRNAQDLFRRMDSQIWEDVRRNPLALLNAVPQARLEALAKDKAFKAHLEAVKKEFEAATASLTDPADPEKRKCTAYFSLEYGIDEGLRIYSGGLGVLAGDHLKAASDIGTPLVAVGLLYREGYFQQYLNSDGWQQERYRENLIDMLPLSRARNLQGQDISVTVPLPEGTLHANLWRLAIGRVSLYLLDANVPENSHEFRRITDQLYGGDKRNRLRQELLLGIGGFRALIDMGYDPQACHLNEGHAAFTSLARLAYLTRQRGMSLDAALEIVPRTSIFTTHTPVPAGNETFELDLIKPHLQALQPEVGLPADTMTSWGQVPGAGADQEFSMTVFGLKMANSANGVSKLHGDVARGMWQHLWVGYPQDEVPITHVTNGVHFKSWVSPENEELYDRYLGPEWGQNPSAADVLLHVDEIPDTELWRAHTLGRSHLVRYARELAVRQCRQRNAAQAELQLAGRVLDSDVLTICFARRFATYKRAALLLRDPERLVRLLTDPERPVQMIFAGKAHPADDGGKDLIRQIVEFSRRPEVQGRILFIENYDIGVARCMVQGADVWLNNPRRPHEASGTSGMKATLNGALHMSTLDGWWCEGYSAACGWAIGDGEEYEDTVYQDAVEGLALYNLLENEVVPTYYGSQESGMPKNWVKMMKASIGMTLKYFSSRRMVDEYITRFYKPAHAACASLTADGGALANEMVTRHNRLRALWGRVNLEMLEQDQNLSQVHVGDQITVRTRVHLGELLPKDVVVQVYSGPVDSTNKIVSSHAVTMEMENDEGFGSYIYGCKISCGNTGRFGLICRVRPAGEDWQRVVPGFMTWADGRE